jgi:hypothetical protein
MKAIGAGIAISVCFFYLGCGSVQMADAAHGSNTAPLAITTRLLPSAIAGTPYVAALDATGGTPGYTWAITSGYLPSGLSLASSTGVISGTPAVSGVFILGLTLRDSGSDQKASLVRILVTPASMSIAPTTTLFAADGVAFSNALTVIGGTPGYAWQLTSGSLPAGLSLGSSTGILSGTPTTSGITSFTVAVRDSEMPARTQSTVVTMDIASGQVRLAPIATATTVEGAFFSETLQAIGGTAPYTWSISSGQLSPGLTLGQTGIISGVPTTSGSSNFTVAIVDSGNPAQSASTGGTVAVTPTPLRATAPVLPTRPVGATYSQPFSVSGGTAPYNWRVTSGSMPAGLILTPAGVVSGTAQVSGTTNFTATVSDSSNPGQSASATAAIVVAPTSLTITSSALASGTVGSSYSQSLQASGGTAPYVWTITSGRLPAGLTLTQSSGMISGTATTNGTSTFTATVTDSSSPAQVTSTTPTLVVAPNALSIATAQLAQATVGTAYLQTLQATGGTAPYTWSLRSGQLPLGLSWSASGVISGTPTSHSSSGFTVTVTDSGTPTQAQSADMTINSTPAVPVPLSISAALATATTGSVYSQSLQVSGGTPGYTWAIASGSLPSGLTLASTTGIISGTPAASGTSTFTLSVHDNGSPTETQATTASITVSTPQNLSPGSGRTWYVDAAIGGTRYSTNVPTGLCDGTADTAPAGITPNQHCAFKDARMLYQDGSYVSLPGATFPAWGWVGSGGDTYIIMGSVGQGISYPIGWDSLSTYCGSTGCWGVAGQPQSSGMLTPPSGSAASHTKIYGECVLANTCDAKNLSTLTELFGSWGPDNVMSLYGTNYVDVAGFSITDHSNCGFATDYYPCKTNGITQSSFAKNGIQLFNTTTNTTLNHMRIHGLGSFGMYGAVGDGFTATDLVLVGNASGGWNTDDSSGNTGTGHLLVQNFDISWNGCTEEYPIVDPLPYFSCTDQSTGGYGDGFGTATQDSPPPGWQVHFDNGTASFNTQDGLDALHIGGVGSTTSYTRVLAYSSEGNQLKIGGSTATIQNSAVVGNCEALTSGTPIPGRPSPTYDNLGAPCRAGNTAVVLETTPGDPAYYQNNTCYSIGAICLEIEYATGDQGPTNTVQYNNNTFVGFFNVGAGSYPTPIYGTNGLAMVTSNPGSSFSNNIYLNPRANWGCPRIGEPSSFCGDPGLVDETYHVYGYGNMAPASISSTVVGSGIAIPSITLDYTGYTRPNPPSIGAYEYPH